MPQQLLIFGTLHSLRSRNHRGHFLQHCRSHYARGDDPSHAICGITFARVVFFLLMIQGIQNNCSLHPSSWQWVSHKSWFWMLETKTVSPGPIISAWTCYNQRLYLHGSTRDTSQIDPRCRMDGFCHLWLDSSSSSRYVGPPGPSRPTDRYWKMGKE